MGDVAQPARVRPERPGCFGTLWFSFVGPLITDGYKRPLTVEDAFPLPSALTSEITTAEFDVLWAEECAAAELLVAALSPEERATSERLSAACKAAQAAEVKADEAVKTADDEVKKAQSDAKKQRGAEAKRAAEKAVKDAKERHSAAQTAQSTAAEVVNTVRAAFRVATPQPSMLRTLWRMCWRMWVGSLVFVLLEAFAPFAGPVALQLVTDRLEKTETITSEECIYVVLLVLCGPLLAGIGQTQGVRINSAVGVKVRAVFCASVFKKSIRLTPAVVQRIGKGRITNLMSIDSAEIYEAFPEVNSAFAGVPILVGGCVMLVQQLGSAAWAGIFAVFLTAPIAGITMARWDVHNRARLETADTRVELLSELLNGIRMVKAFAWEGEQIARVELQRDKELYRISRSGIYNCILMLCFMTMSSVACLCAFAVYSGVQGHTLTASTAFVSLTIFTIIQMPLLMVPFTLTAILSVMNSLRRLGEFLSEPELPAADMLPWGAQRRHAGCYLRRRCARRTFGAKCCAPRVLSSAGVRTLDWSRRSPA